jgi:hypothetical protein
MSLSRQIPAIARKILAEDTIFIGKSDRLLGRMQAQNGHWVHPFQPSGPQFRKGGSRTQSHPAGGFRPLSRAAGAGVDFAGGSPHFGGSAVMGFL